MVDTSPHDGLISVTCRRLLHYLLLHFNKVSEFLCLHTTQAPFLSKCKFKIIILNLYFLSQHKNENFVLNTPDLRKR